MCKKIVAALDVKDGMSLLEIGPGGGALTKYLLEIKGIDYKAIEIDDEKVAYLQKIHPLIEGKLIHKDILKADIPFDGSFSVIGNFPYNISSPILFKILEWEAQVEQVVGMFQKEVAKRIAAQSGNKDYGILSVLTQAYFSTNYLFDVHENCFTPPPKVKSGVIKLENINNPHGIYNRKTFASLVKTAFGQRRKTLRNALRGMLPKDALGQAILDKRAEQLSVEDFVALFKRHFKNEG